MDINKGTRRCAKRVGSASLSRTGAATPVAQHEKPAHEQEQEKEEEEARVCRRCRNWDTEQDLSTLFRPCLCRGAMTYVHRACQQEYITTSAGYAGKCDVCNFVHKYQWRTRRAAVFFWLLKALYCTWEFTRIVFFVCVCFPLLMNISALLRGFSVDAVPGYTVFCSIERIAHIIAFEVVSYFRTIPPLFHYRNIECIPATSSDLTVQMMLEMIILAIPVYVFTYAYTASNGAIINKFRLRYARLVQFFEEGNWV